MAKMAPTARSGTGRKKMVPRPARTGKGPQKKVPLARRGGTVK